MALKLYDADAKDSKVPMDNVYTLHHTHFGEAEGEASFSMPSNESTNIGQIPPGLFETNGIIPETLEPIPKFYRQSELENFPEELHKTILDFVLAFLVENPKDMIDYAVKHFKKIQKTRNECATKAEITKDNAQVMQNLKDTRSQEFGNIWNRRMSVFAERLDIEDELYMEDINAEELKAIGKSNEQRARLLKAIKKIFVFQNLETEQISRILDVMYPIRVSPGDVLSSSSNAENNLFYIIETGDFVVYQNHKIIEELHNNGTIGEISLLHQVTDVPMVKATKEGMVWAMDRKSFKNILLKHLYKQQRMFDKLLSSVKMFEELNQYERLRLVEALVRKSYHAGETIIKQGDEPDGMYFLEEGICSVYVDQMKGRGEVIVNRLNKGRYFGELALLTHAERQASVYAETDVKVAFIDKGSFERLLGKCVDILNRAMEDYNVKDDKLKAYLAEKQAQKYEEDAQVPKK